MMLSGSRLASLVAYDAPYLSPIFFFKSIFQIFMMNTFLHAALGISMRHKAFVCQRATLFFLTSGHSGCAHPQSFKQQFLEGQMSLVFFGVKYSHVLKELKTMIKA